MRRRWVRRCGGWGARFLNDGSCYTPQLRDLDVLETTFSGPGLTTFLEMDTLGLTAVGQLLALRKAVIKCRTPAGFKYPFCKACGAQGQARGTAALRSAHEPHPWHHPRIDYL